MSFNVEGVGGGGGRVVSRCLVTSRLVRGTSASEDRSRLTRKLRDQQHWKKVKAARAIVKSKVCELAVALELLVVTICKSQINHITHPNPVYSHTVSHDSMLNRSETQLPTNVSRRNSIRSPQLFHRQTDRQTDRQWLPSD
jgi:hypothetical protein